MKMVHKIKMKEKYCLHVTINGIHLFLEGLFLIEDPTKNILIKRSAYQSEGKFHKIVVKLLVSYGSEY